MNKNPNDNDTTKIFVDPINLVFSDDTFAKEVIILRIIEEFNLPVIYLDFDLLFTGYVKSGIVRKTSDITTFLPKIENWQEVLKKTISELSQKNYIVMIDSLNGFFITLDRGDSGRYANSCFMMFVSLLKNSKCKIFFHGIAKQKEKDGWILYPPGRKVLENKQISKFFVRCNESLQIESVDFNNQIRKITKI